MRASTSKTGINTRKARLKLPENGKDKPEIHKKSVLNDVKLSIFLTAIENGLLLKDALDEAEMTDMQYRRLIKRSSTFRIRLRKAERKLHILAKSKIAGAMNQGDMTTVRWWAEKKIPEEFGRTESELPQVGNITVIVPMGNKPHPRIVPEKPHGKDS